MNAGLKSGTIIHARAPVRNADLGGWRDTRLFDHGFVLNFAIRLYTYVTLSSRQDAAIELEGQDVGETERIADIRAIEYDGALSLIKAALTSSQMKAGGFHMAVRSEAPPASGLGSSAAVGVSALGALHRLNGQVRLPYQIASEAQRLETEILHQECGVQDQLCSAYGGINYIEVRYPEAHVMPVHLAPGTLLDLEARSLVVYTGKSHFSSGTHKSVISHFEMGDPNTIDAMDRLNETAEWGLRSLLADDLEGYAEALNYNWTQQKRLHPTITTPQVEAMHEAVLDAGAIGFKLNGAGAGGTAMVLCRHDRVHTVRDRLQEEFPEAVIFPMKLDLGQHQGMQVWETRRR
ncbi:MAG: hypothetical protein PHC78_10280 [Verrucomicrobiota bacterium]|nr:hypothetical protein [Verrucomicrobiota bacterium]